MHKRRFMNKIYPVTNYQDYRPSRNPYFEVLGALEKSSAKPLALLDASTEKNRGSWRQYFGVPESAELELELGCYHGETLHALAKQSPERVHLGVEWKYKQCFKAAKKAADQKLTNLCFLRANISRLPWMVAPGEVNRVFIFFPDPWSKSTHQKWRVLHAGFFRALGCLLNEGAELFLKTDHPDYAVYIQESLAEAGCFSPLSEERAAKVWARVPPTPFEKIFLRQGLKIHPFALVRNAEKVIPPEPVQDILGFARN